MLLQQICRRLTISCAGIAATIVAAPAAAFVPFSPDVAVEFYHAGFDHFFLTQIPEEIDGLDSGRFKGWTRTGRGIKVYLSDATPGAEGSNPVCRFYIPPQHGDSHFFSASPAECSGILAKIGVDPNYSGYLYEAEQVFRLALPNLSTGTCPANTVPVYRLWNQRTDSNHRYTTDAGVKAGMIRKGYLAEGYGPDVTSLCTPAEVLLDAQTRASGPSPFAANCEGVAPSGTAAIGAEVEPHIAVNPTFTNNLIGVWQQDRWSNGGARGVAGAYSLDGGGSWTRMSAPFSRCTGGNVANGGNYERATDPWIAISHSGIAYWVVLAFNNLTNANNAILVSQSSDLGKTWSDPVTLRVDGADAFNDKEALTVDPQNSGNVYVVWDRLFGTGGPSWMARSESGGTTWLPAREIYNPGENAQTINNQIAVLTDGTLVLFFTELATTGNANARLRILRSTDRGETWSLPITIASHQGLGTVDPDTGAPIRDGSILGAIAAGADGSLAVVWQDSRFASGARDGVAFSRSVDGGLTWTAPLRVNGAPNVAAFLPTVAIRADGVIGVAYHDLRSNTADPITLPTDTWLATSSDGVTWQERALAPAFDFALAPRAGPNLFLGDYTGLVGVDKTFVAFSARTTADASNRSDMFAALQRDLITTTLSVKQQAVATAIAQPLASSPAIDGRLDAIARRTLAERIPEGILPKTVAQ